MEGEGSDREGVRQAFAGGSRDLATHIRPLNGMEFLVKSLISFLGGPKLRGWDKMSLHDRKALWTTPTRWISSVIAKRLCACQMLPIIRFRNAKISPKRPGRLLL